CNSAGNCTWDITALDENNNLQTDMTVVSGTSFTKVVGEVMEVPHGKGCVEMPANGHAAFRQLLVETHAQGIVTPSFSTFTPNRQCSVSVTASPTGGDI